MNVRQLGLMGEPAMRVVFYFNLIATLLSGAWMVQTEAHNELDNLWLLLAIGATATFAQLAMTHAYRIGQTQVVSTLSYSTIVFASYSVCCCGTKCCVSAAGSASYSSLPAAC